MINKQKQLKTIFLAKQKDSKQKAALFLYYIARKISPVYNNEYLP